ncbi:hypothetical protein VYU27_006092 [Nannochloropsis oceanica]
MLTTPTTVVGYHLAVLKKERKYEIVSDIKADYVEKENAVPSGPFGTSTAIFLTAVSHPRLSVGRASSAARFPSDEKNM